MNCQNPWMVKKEREQTRIGWQNGLLDYNSIYAYLVVSKLLHFTHPLLGFCIGSCAQPKQGCHGGEEDWVRGRSRGGAHGGVDGVSAGRAEMVRHGEGERWMGCAGGGEAARLHENEAWLLGIGSDRSSLGVMVFRLDGLPLVV
jgi:hypothetical protein